MSILFEVVPTTQVTAATDRGRQQENERYNAKGSTAANPVDAVDGDVEASEAERKIVNGIARHEAELPDAFKLPIAVFPTSQGRAARKSQISNFLCTRWSP